ncbi:SET domain-containing protein [Aulographum hederae CBS 113979]|uniref:SET domain-containing protein n=1 Tax=Aulographum hederae CBS 113979 TaxID=1176131 RepID=A0A6G1H1E4_9PEZI|nr:SET domain-containing protein [Aulographum hederae CBS 113979]
MPPPPRLPSLAVLPLPNRGLGVIARTPIPRGTRIFSEHPLLALRHDQDASDVYAASRLLTQEQRAVLMGLSGNGAESSLEGVGGRERRAWRWLHVGPRLGTKTELMRLWKFPTVRRLKRHMAVLSIFRSNAFDLGNAATWQQAVFPTISRLNHACVPNAQGNFHEGTGKFNVHTIRDVQEGEEVTLNYLQEVGMVRNARREKLSKGYGFECGCPACDLGMERGRVGEKRRVEMQRTLGEYARGVGEGQPGGVGEKEKELRTFEAFIEMFEGEGIAGRELAAMYFESSRLHKALGNHDEALRCADKGLFIDEDCLGTDHAIYQTGRETVEALRSLAVSEGPLRAVAAG